MAHYSATATNIGALTKLVIMLATFLAGPTSGFMVARRLYLYNADPGPKRGVCTLFCPKSETCHCALLFTCRLFYEEEARETFYS